MQRHCGASHSDAENEDPNSRPKKRTRCDVRGKMDAKMGRIEDLLQESLEQNASHQKKMVYGIQEANRAYVTSQRELLSVVTVCI